MKNCGNFIFARHNPLQRLNSWYGWTIILLAAGSLVVPTRLLFSTKARLAIQKSSILSKPL